MGRLSTKFGPRLGGSKRTIYPVDPDACLYLSDMIEVNCYTNKNINMLRLKPQSCQIIYNNLVNNKQNLCSIVSDIFGQLNIKYKINKNIYK